ncbi:MAG: methionyl-tRNA formyltransferase [Clostridia bacterium]|nr:methionyl-tRNA formyltransferase [Clostridia bacterium]
MKILFMGTPAFAVVSLDALVAAGHEICGVVTKKDTPQGRKMRLTPPPVKVRAEELGLPVFQPDTLRDEAFSGLLARLDPELIVVVAYGKILPASVLSYPPFGCVNVHGSLLPAYRGAAPMQRSLMDGQEVVGVTTMYMDEGMDTGDMLLTRTYRPGENECFGSVSDALARLGADALTETLRKLEAGTLVRVPQDGRLATVAPKIDRGEETLDFSLPARVLHNRIRALSPAPLCRTFTPDGSLLKIVSSSLPGLFSEGEAGEVLTDEKKLLVCCGDGRVLEIAELLPEGKQRMKAADYLRGRKLKKGDLLGKKEN